MRSMLLLLLLPVYALSQNVPVEKGRVIYENEVAVPNASRAELYSRAKDALAQLERYASPNVYRDSPDNGEMEATGSIPIDKKNHQEKYAVGYHLQIQVTDNKYSYRIDSVQLLHYKRHKTKEKPVEDLLKDVNNSDKVAVETEMQVNEMDMDILKLIDLLNNEMTRKEKS
jgi:Domain of unknown function (DUF4468) with TBP-like fold